MAGPEIVLLDLDSTLLDHDTAVAEAALGWREHQDVLLPDDIRSEPDEDFLTRWEAAASRYWRPYLRGEITFETQRRTRIRELMVRPGGSAPSEADLDTAVALFIERYERAWRLYPDVAPMLECMPGRRLGIITNGDGAQQRAKLARLGLSDRVDPVVISAEADVAKPDVAIFAKAAMRAGLAPARCVYVGDREDSDARAASAAGMTGIWLDRAGTGGDRGEVGVIHDLLAVPRLVR